MKRRSARHFYLVTVAKITALMIPILLVSPTARLQNFGEVAIATAASEKPSLQDHKWTITNIGSHTGKHLGFITFGNGQLEGQSTCNRFSAVYKSGDDNSLTVFAIGATQLVCQVGDTMEIETAFLADLEAVQSYKFAGDTLILLKENDVEIARLK